MSDAEVVDLDQTYQQPDQPRSADDGVEWAGGINGHADRWVADVRAIDNPVARYRQASTEVDYVKDVLMGAMADVRAEAAAEQFFNAGGYDHHGAQANVAKMLRVDRSQMGALLRRLALDRSNYREHPVYLRWRAKRDEERRRLTEEAQAS